MHHFICAAVMAVFLCLMSSAVIANDAIKTLDAPCYDRLDLARDLILKGYDFDHSFVSDDGEIYHMYVSPSGGWILTLIIERGRLSCVLMSGHSLLHKRDI